jgi:hypothetical protein
MIQTEAIWNSMLLALTKWNIVIPNEVIEIHDHSGFILKVRIKKTKMHSAELRNFIGQPSHIRNKNMKLIEEVIIFKFQ